MIDNEELLKSLLKKRGKISFNDLKNKLRVNEFNLKNTLIDFMIKEIKNFNFRTCYKKHQYLKKCFIYLDYKLDNKLGQNNILINKLNKLVSLIDNVLETDMSKKNYDNYLLNQELLLSLKEECNYTIMLLSLDLIKKEENQDYDNLYALLKYVIFENNDLVIFKSLVNCVSFENQDINKEIVIDVLKKYLSVNDNYLKLYYEEILEEFILSDYSYLKAKDLKNIRDNLNEVNQKFNQNREINLDIIKKKYGVDDSFPYNYLEQINDLSNDFFIDKTNEKMIAIDTEGTKLRENVFDITINDNSYVLTLYVPAISLMVKENSDMELLAYQKGVALANKSLFPKEFLIENCSLDKGKDIYTIGYQFNLDSNFKLISVTAQKFKIKVSENLSPNEIKDILNDSNTGWIGDKISFLANLSTLLKGADNSKNYFQAKDLNNRLNFRTNRENYDKISRKIIDGLTVYANYQMAKYFLNHNWPFIYRNNDFNDDFILIKEAMRNTNSNELKQLLDRLRVNSYFSTINTGHSGLKKDAYSQISTPCRNLAAYMCQRQIITFLIDNQDLNELELETLKDELTRLANHINSRYKINESYLKEMIKIKKRGC